MICPQIMSNIEAKFCKGDEDIEYQSVMWIPQHMDSDSDCYVLHIFLYVLLKALPPVCMKYTA